MHQLRGRPGEGGSRKGPESNRRAGLKRWGLWGSPGNRLSPGDARIRVTSAGMGLGGGGKQTDPQSVSPRSMAGVVGGGKGSCSGLDPQGQG